jgi:IrrE N-terminal-like domain
MRYIRDSTGRFSQRPYFIPAELDRECEQLVTALLREKHGEVNFPIATSDLEVLIEREAEDLDCYADLSAYGPNVEGVTEFRPGRKPTVQISLALSDSDRRENRLRTTLSHEFGHVHFHGPLFAMDPAAPDLLRREPNRNKIICKRDTMLEAPQSDWMEWQAGYVCGAILMPASAVRRLVADYKQNHGLYGPVAPDSDHGKAIVGQVMHAFAVSSDAARVRLHKLNVLGAHLYERSLFG